MRGNNNKYETSQGNNHNNNKNGRKSLKINQSAVAHTHTPRPAAPPLKVMEEKNVVARGMAGGGGVAVVHIIHSVISNNKNNSRQCRLQRGRGSAEAGAGLYRGRSERWQQGGRRLNVVN